MNYLIEVSICWLVFYLLYLLLLSKETFFRVNRTYLLSTLLAGLIIPLLHLSFPSTVMQQDFVVMLEPITVGVENFEHTLEEIVVVSGTEEQDYFWLLKALYFLGILMVFGKSKACEKRGSNRGERIIGSSKHSRLICPFPFSIPCI